MTARFTNIPAGDYVFRVKAQSEAGYWTPKITTIDIRVLPPWWQTWWAYLLYLAVILAILYSIYHFRLNQKLAKAETQKLQELARVKTELYTNITHEFRTPLTIIKGMASQIKTTPKEAESLIRRNSSHLLHLVNQLLDMSKMEAGKMELSLIQNNIIAFLRYLTQSFQSYAAIQDIQLSFVSEDEEVLMNYDAEKLQHIVANLLSNAVKFSPKNTTVVLHTALIETKTEADTTWLQIKVIDKGMGIAETQIPHIFDRFYQADGSHTRRGEGTGIGLALVKCFVELMKGTVSVKSTLGQGSTFKVLLPVTQTAPAETLVDSKTILNNNAVEALASSPASTIIEPSSALEKNNLPLLLVIEDHPDIISYIKICLKSAYNIHIAKDGQKGIDKALELIPDIIISDVMMPEKDGFEVTHTLKNDERTSHIPLILLTAKSDINSKIDGLESGADAYLAKPFNEKELKVRLQKLIELRRKMQSRYAAFSTPTPLVEKEEKATKMEDAFLIKMNAILEKNINNVQFKVEDLSRQLGMSQSQLYRKIKALTGLSLVNYIRTYRLKKAKHLLATTELNISEVAYETGFSSPAYFSRTFAKEFGFPPSQLKEDIY